MTEPAMVVYEAACSSFGPMDCAAAIEQTYDPWAELDLFGLVSGPGCPTDLEEIYAGVHRSVDQAVSTISQEGRFTPETIKQQNRKVVEKLSVLEDEVLRRTPSSSTSSMSGRGTSATPAGMYPDVVRLHWALKYLPP